MWCTFLTPVSSAYGCINHVAATDLQPEVHVDLRHIILLFVALALRTDIHNEEDSLKTARKFFFFFFFFLKKQQ